MQETATSFKLEKCDLVFDAALLCDKHRDFAVKAQGFLRISPSAGSLGSIVSDLFKPEDDLRK